MMRFFLENRHWLVASPKGDTGIPEERQLKSGHYTGDWRVLSTLFFLFIGFFTWKPAAQVWLEMVEEMIGCAPNQGSCIDLVRGASNHFLHHFKHLAATERGRGAGREPVRHPSLCEGSPNFIISFSYKVARS